jgi:methylated-DNA-[protein]-cysteine S-methyltransferase
VQDADRIGSVSFALFDTALGRCALVWCGGSVIGFALPGTSDADTSAHLKRRHADASPAEPPATIATAIAGVQRLLAGEPAELSNIPVDLAGVPPFEQRIYALLREVGPGATITYGELAERAGSPGAARAVGAAMGRNPVPVIIPCHRVLAGGGRSGGFSAPGGVTTKFRLLQIERAGRGGGAMLFDDLPLAVAPSSPRT